MFESHKLSEIMSALFCGLFSNARDHSGLRLSLSCAEPASDLPGPRMVSQPQDRDCALGRGAGGGLPRVGQLDARGLPLVPRELVV